MIMITPANKDKILAAIASRDESAFYIYYDDIFQDKEISLSKFELILYQMVKIGLLKKVSPTTSSSCYVEPTAELFDFLSHGGFIAQEEILRANLEKLDYELMKLAKEIDPSLSTSVEKITGIAASIATALNLFSS